MDGSMNGPLTAYPRHSSYSSGARPAAPPTAFQPIQPMTQHNRYHQYSSDPTLLDDARDVTDDTHSAVSSVVLASRSGRRSAQDNYPQEREEKNMAKEARKEKKRKLKRLKSFVHVFLGGLRKGQSFQVSSEDPHRDDDSGITATRYEQRKERNGIIPSSSVGSGGANHTAASRSESDSRKLVLPRVPSSHYIPGLCGLHNHGNTCFMNAVIQCLSNTNQLAEYFVTDQYKNDINRQKSNSRKFGTNGDVTEQFAVLLKCLWNSQYDPRVTAYFKEVIGSHASQYQGSSQHDAQEFFLWLLDNVHEDLNQAGKKKYRPIKDSTGRPDEDVATETLISHMKSNNSFIQNLFQGQFRSAIICPSCNTRSCTFDPYVCVSLPLPQRENRPIYVTVVYRSSNRKSKVFGVNVSINALVRNLRNRLAEICGIHRNHLVLTDLTPNGFNRTFYDDQHISVVNSGDLMFGFECPPYRGDNLEAITHANPSGSKELILILVINKFGKTQYGKRFGPPLILRIWRDLTHSQFQSVVLKSMACYLREGVRLADVCRSGVLFQCRVVDGLPGRCVLPTDAEDHPFYSPSVDKALEVSMLYGGPTHLKLIAEWEMETKANVFGVVPEIIPDPHDSVMELRQLYQQPLQCSLSDCLHIYTKEETLNREDQWFCPHCRRQQQDATKKITLWTLPDVLVVHLKRFRHAGYCRTKLNTLVDFPINNLDMTPFLAPRTSRPSSATLERKNRILGNSSRSSRTLPSKSVHFEDDFKSNKSVNRSASSKDHAASSSTSSKFHLPWKKSKKASKESKQPSSRSSTKSPDSNFAPSVCDSPMSTRSAPSAIGHSVFQSPTHRGGRPRSPLSQSPHSSPHHKGGSGGAGGLGGISGGHPPHHLGFQSFDQTRLDNVYDLYAICNHLGSMSRGHYTAYCRNPADGNWYTFDDQLVQPISEEQLITSGAYMLFYVRQSLLVQSPLSGSDSSTSSGGSSSNHWIYHIPQFRLDLGSLGSDGSTQSSNVNVNMNEPKANTLPRQRLNSTNSAVSAPPVTGIRGISPQASSSHDGSDVFSPPVGQNVDAHSAVSLPPYQPQDGGYYSHLTPQKHQQQPPPSQNHPQFNRYTSYPASAAVPTNYGPKTPPTTTATTPSVISPTSLRQGPYGGRGYASMRATKSHHSSPPPDMESSLRRGASFHSPRGHHHHQHHHHPQHPPQQNYQYHQPRSQLHRTMTDSGERNYYPPPPNPNFPPTQGVVAPSRSIPNMPSETSSPPPGVGGYHFQFPPHQTPVMPSRSIPNMPAEMTPGGGGGRPAAARSFSEDPSKAMGGIPNGQFFMTPQPRRNNNMSFGTPSHQVSRSGTESCV